MIWDVVIVGGGPGGMQAAVAAASEGLKVLVLEKAKVGGQIGQTPKLENSIFANGGVTGPELARMMREQAERMGVHIEAGEAVRLVPGQHFHRIERAGATHFDRGRTVILAMGNRWNDLGIPGMKEGIAAGTIHVGPVECLTAAVEDKEVAVFGGGPSAGQAIIELAGRAREVHVILRSVFKMPKYLTDRIDDLPNVTVYKHTKIETLTASTLGVGIHVRERPDEMLDVSYLFACNGLMPATDWLKGSGVKLDDGGRVITHLPSLQTHVPGVWAIGDCRAGSTPRVGVAIGDGSMAVTELWNHFIKNPVCKDCKQIFSAAGVKV